MGYPTIDVDPGIGGCAGCDPNHPGGPPFPPLYQAEKCTVLCTSFSEIEAQLCADANAWLCANSPVDPNDPTTRTTTPATVFHNSTQTCSFTCPDGKEFTWTVLPGVFVGSSQHAADFQAHQYACFNAQRRWICLSDIPEVACLDTDVNDTITASRPGVAVQVVTLKISNGSLPPGLTFQQTGPLKATITGKPTATGFYHFTVTADSADNAQMNKDYLIAVLGITNSPTAGVVCTAYSFQLNGDGGVPPYAFAITSGSLPTGLAMNATGLISGTPQIPGSFAFDVTISDDEGDACVKHATMVVTGASNRASGIQWTPTLGIPPNVGDWSSDTTVGNNITVKVRGAWGVGCVALLSNVNFAGPMQNCSGATSSILITIGWRFDDGAGGTMNDCNGAYPTGSVTVFWNNNPILSMPNLNGSGGNLNFRQGSSNVTKILANPEAPGHFDINMNCSGGGVRSGKDSLMTVFISLVQTP